MQRPGLVDASTRSRKHSLSQVVARAVIVAVAVGVLAGGFAACGQRGPLYNPDPANPDKKR